MRRTRWTSLAIVLALAATACGGDDADTDVADTDVAGEPVEQELQDAATAPLTTDDADDPDGDSDDSGDSDDLDGTSDGADGSDGSGDADSAVSGEVPVPIARFTAHGPAEPNTFGPGCAVGIDDSGGDVFRFTAPTSWTRKGSSGGTGSDQMELKDDTDVSLFVTLAAYDYDTEALRDWQVIAPAGVDIEIDGVTIPIMEISLEGDPGYAIVGLEYLGPMPGLSTGAALGTVALTSPEPGRPTLDEAAQLLSTVRIERCAAVGEAMIWGPVGGVRLVPKFEPDPLGKAYPDQPQPVYEPTVGVLASYTLEQVAYLMPVEADVAMCAAEQAVASEAGNPIAYLFMFTPSGTNKDDLDAIVAQC